MSSGAAFLSFSWMTLLTFGCPAGSNASSSKSRVFDSATWSSLKGFNGCPFLWEISTQRAVTGTITSWRRAARGP